MTYFVNKLSRYATALKKVQRFDNELTDMIKNHLGDDWAITYDRADGILLLSPDAYNYRIGDYVHTLGMPREEAIAYIEAHPFN